MTHEAVPLFYLLITVCVLLFSPGCPVPLCQTGTVSVLFSTALAGSFLPPQGSTRPTTSTMKLLTLPLFLHFTGLAAALGSTELLFAIWRTFIAFPPCAQPCATVSANCDAGLGH